MAVTLVIIKIDESFPFERYLHWLPPSSQQKINQYYFRVDKVRAFASELLKYYFLAGYLSIAPQQIQIKYTELGRPILGDGLPRVNFSIAHSGAYVVMACSKDEQVGVDIEHIDAKINPEELAPTVFSESERQLIGRNIDAFFMLWTKKEALFKAHGTGFINDYYMHTALTLEGVEVGDGYKMYSQKFADNYYLSLCLLK